MGGSEPACLLLTSSRMTRQELISLLSNEEVVARRRAVLRLPEAPVETLLREMQESLARMDRRLELEQVLEAIERLTQGQAATD